MSRRADVRADVLAVGPRVYLRRPTAADRAVVLAAARASVALHRGRVRPPRNDREYGHYLARARSGALLHLAFRTGDDALVGAVNLGDLARGSLEHARLGYFGFAGATGEGYVREAVALVVGLGFRRLRLHRLEADVQPDNLASIRLLEALGFRREGFSPRFAKLGGRWRDHLRYAILREEWRSARRPAADRLAVVSPNSK